MFICGHYEEVDERVRKFLATDDVSIGDYILSGGEFACMVVIDAIVRLLPNAVGNEKSILNESFLRIYWIIHNIPDQMNI